jgi:hemerythrin
LGYDIDFSELIPKMVQRLRTEHRDFRLKLIQIEASETSSHKAIEMLKATRKPILRHAVEDQSAEEAKDQSEQSIKVIQEHRGIIEFLEKRISQLDDSIQDITIEIKTFGDDMRKHFSEEEEIVFPLALKVDSM